MMWLTHGEETAHTEGIKVHWWNVAPVHTYILAIKKSQWRLAVTPTSSPHGKQSVSIPMLVFVHFLCRDCLAWIPGLFISQQIELPEGWLAGLALPCSNLTQELVLTHHHFFAEAVVRHTLQCYGRVALDCGLGLYTWEIGSGDCRSWDGGLWRGLSMAGYSHCHSHPVGAARAEHRNPQKSADGKMLQGASKSALPSGQDHLYLPFPTDVCLTL